MDCWLPFGLSITCHRLLIKPGSSSANTIIPKAMHLFSVFESSHFHVFGHWSLHRLNYKSFEFNRFLRNHILNLCRSSFPVKTFYRSHLNYLRCLLKGMITKVLSSHLPWGCISMGVPRSGLFLSQSLKDLSLIWAKKKKKRESFISQPYKSQNFWALFCLQTGFLWVHVTLIVPY